MKEYRDLEERYKKYLPNNTNARAKSTIDKYWDHVKKALDKKGNYPTKWTQNDADDYRAYMKRIYNKNSDTPENENTLIPHCAALNHYFKMLDLNIKLKIPRKTDISKDPLTMREMDKMEECAKDESLRDNAILRTLRETMQRVTDVSMIDIDKINKERLEIKMYIKKTSKWHIAPISEFCMKAINQYIIHERIEPIDQLKALFTTKNGNRVDRRIIWEIVRKYSARASINKKVYPHLYRHSGITNLEESGVPPKDGMRLSGHKDIRAYMHYAQSNTKGIRSAFEKGVLGNHDDSKNDSTLNHSMGVLTTNNESEMIPMLSDDMREKLLLDSLLTGRISEETYLNALAKVRRSKQNKEVSGYY